MQMPLGALQSFAGHRAKVTPETIINFLGSMQGRSSIKAQYPNQTHKPSLPYQLPILLLGRERQAR
jgi:hypothetical protein